MLATVPKGPSMALMGPQCNLGLAKWLRIAISGHRNDKVIGTSCDLSRPKLRIGPMTPNPEDLSDSGGPVWAIKGI